MTGRIAGRALFFACLMVTASALARYEIIRHTIDGGDRKIKKTCYICVL